MATIPPKRPCLETHEVLTREVVLRGTWLGMTLCVRNPSFLCPASNVPNDLSSLSSDWGVAIGHKGVVLTQGVRGLSCNTLLSCAAPPSPPPSSAATARGGPAEVVGVVVDEAEQARSEWVGRGLPLVHHIPGRGRHGRTVELGHQTAIVQVRGGWGLWPHVV